VPSFSTDMTRYDAVNFIAHGVAKDPAFGEARPVTGSPEDGDDFVDTDGEVKESALAKYCVDLNIKAKEGDVDPLIGRSHEVERCIQVLCRRRKNNPLLVGDPGVGKTAIAEGLAFKIVNGDTPDVLSETTIYSLDILRCRAANCAAWDRQHIRNSASTLKKIAHLRGVFRKST